MQASKKLLTLFLPMGCKLFFKIVFLLLGSPVEQREVTHLASLNLLSTSCQFTRFQKAAMYAGLLFW